MTNVWLGFWAKFGQSSNITFMDQTVEVWNGASWVTVLSNLGYFYDSDWDHHEVDITAHKGATTKVQWCYEKQATATGSSFGGWNLDDVSISPVDCDN
jgi:hypothetical protein